MDKSFHVLTYFTVSEPDTLILEIFTPSQILRRAVRYWIYLLIISFIANIQSFETSMIDDCFGCWWILILVDSIMKLARFQKALRGALKSGLWFWSTTWATKVWIMNAVLMNCEKEKDWCVKIVYKKICLLKINDCDYPLIIYRKMKNPRYEKVYTQFLSNE